MNKQEPTAKNVQGTVFLVDEDNEGRRLDRVVKAVLGEAGSFGLVQKLVRKGAVRLNGKRAKADTRVARGDQISVPSSLMTQTDQGNKLSDDAGGQAVSSQPSPSLSPSQAKTVKVLEALRAGIVFDDGHNIVAFNKPSGLAVQGGSKTRLHVDGLLTHFSDAQGRVPKLVHRLDRDTSGVLLTLRGAKAAAEAGKAFADRTTQKTYLAWCWGRPSTNSGMVDARLSKGRGQGNLGEGKEQVFVDPAGGQPAQSLFRLLATGRVSGGKGPRLSLIEWRPLTGRTHQLRVHAAHLGNSIVGDPKYGHAPRLDVQEPDQALVAGLGLQLHAARLEIALGGQRHVISAEPPTVMVDLLARIGQDPQRRTLDEILAL